MRSGISREIQISQVSGRGIGCNGVQVVLAGSQLLVDLSLQVGQRPHQGIDALGFDAAGFRTLIQLLKQGMQVIGLDRKAVQIQPPEAGSAVH